MRKHILIPLIIRSNYTNIREQKRNIERNTKNLEIYPMQKKKQIPNLLFAQRIKQDT